MNKGHDGEMWPKHTVKVKAPLGPPAVRRGWLDELQKEVILRGAVLLRVEVDVARVGGGRDSAGGGLSLGDALLCVGGRRLGPRCHGPRDGHPVRVVAGLQDMYRDISFIVGRDNYYNSSELQLFIQPSTRGYGLCANEN